MKTLICVCVISGCWVSGCLGADDTAKVTPSPAAKPVSKPANHQVNGQVKKPSPATPTDAARTTPHPVAKPVIRPVNHPVNRQIKKTSPLAAIPKDAVQTAPGFYRWTDKNGKVWTYRLSPFGVTRYPADSVRDAGAKDGGKEVDGLTTAVEEGDSIRFERSTPFGKRTWVRKKTELDENEQKIWDSQKKNNTADHAADHAAAEKE